MGSLSSLYDQRKQVKASSPEGGNLNFLDLSQASVKVRFLQNLDGTVCIARKKHYNINSNGGVTICPNWSFSDEKGLVKEKDKCPVCHLIELLLKSTDEDLFSRADSSNVKSNILPKFRYIWPNVLDLNRFALGSQSKDSEVLNFSLGVIEKGPKFFDEFALIAIEERETFGDITSLSKGANIKLYNKMVQGWTSWTMQVLEKDISLSQEAIVFIKNNLVSTERIDSFYKYPTYEEIYEKLDNNDKILLKDIYSGPLADESGQVALDLEEDLLICKSCTKQASCEKDGYYEDAIMSDGKKCSVYESMTTEPSKEVSPVTDSKPKRFMKSIKR